MGCRRCAAADAFAEGVEEEPATAVLLLGAALLLLLVDVVAAPSLPLPFDSADADADVDGVGAFLIVACANEEHQHETRSMKQSLIHHHRSTYGGIVVGGVKDVGNGGTCKAPLQSRYSIDSGKLVVGRGVI